MLLNNLAILLFLFYFVNYGSAETTTINPNDYVALAKQYGWMLESKCKGYWITCNIKKDFDDCVQMMEEIQCKAQIDVIATKTTATTTNVVPEKYEDIALKNGWETTSVTDEPAAVSFVQLMDYYLIANFAKMLSPISLQECQNQCLNYVEGDKPCIGLEYLKENSTCALIVMMFDIRAYPGPCNTYVVDRKFPTTDGLDFYEKLVEMNVYATNQVCPDSFTQDSQCQCLSSMDSQSCTNFYAPFLKAVYDSATLQCIIKPRNCA